MTTPLTLSTERRADGRPVLIAVGEIDMSNVDAFASALREAVGTGDTLTVDLSAVEYLDSKAINALYVHADHLHLVANSRMMPVLRISGLTELVSVEPAEPPPAAT
ncbi:anti-anti-sigma factor [Mycobacterium kansasii]|uniref:Anti-sigma-B factor antagonist n=1 Tax=Mycobacterium innocens TaxID=2341083 RepID=A0A498PPC3_9MYCO|nr:MULTISPECIES: STAS domain-containing protein [Mycobacterium]KZS68910.1 anti-anti-sigma factor [Mycobacterium kansasii]VBA32934.1 Anti-sigma-B factor antagonist [Mycobacterium innocens]